MTNASFAVRAYANPQTLPRLLNYFAQLALLPKRVVADEHDGEMRVVIEIADLGDHQAGIIAEKMRSSFLVDAVELSRDRRALTPLSEVAL